jgi:hypothetical protein
MRIIKTFEGYKELDKVLDKISKKGEDSLTRKEKEYLKDWDIDKELEDEEGKVFEDGLFYIEVLNTHPDDLHPTNIIFKIKMEYKGKEYIGDVFVDSSNPASFYWEIYDFEGNDFEPDPSDFYDLDDLIEEMTTANIRTNEWKRYTEKKEKLRDEIKKYTTFDKGYYLNSNILKKVMQNEKIKLKYSNLVRLMAFGFLRKWQPNKYDSVRESEVNLMRAKSAFFKLDRNDFYLSCFFKIGSNRVFYKAFMQELQLNIDKIDLNEVSDIYILNRVWDIVNDIFNNQYEKFLKVFNKIVDLNRLAKESEDLISQLVLENKIDKFKGYMPLEVDRMTDIKGIDLSFEKNNDRLDIQVKRVSNFTSVSIEVEEDNTFLKIPGSKLDIHTRRNNKKIYDYLIIHCPRQKKLYILDSDKIKNHEIKSGTIIIEIDDLEIYDI